MSYDVELIDGFRGTGTNEDKFPDECMSGRINYRHYPRVDGIKFEEFKRDKIKTRVIMTLQIVEHHQKN